jgi:Histidine kinase
LNDPEANRAMAQGAVGAAPDERNGPGSRPGLAWSLWSLPRLLLVTLSANTAIAAFFWLVRPTSFVRSLVYSQAIGFSICTLSWALHRWRREKALRWKLSLVAVPLGGVVGIALARLWDAGAQGESLLENPRLLAPALAGALVFGTAISYFFHTRAAVAEGRAKLREEMLRRLENEQRLTEADLKMLQAQIEPHFLFNTLSNVIGLIDERPAEARRMLLSLTSYLRGSLQRTRSARTTLGEELNLVRAYLEIQSVRMGQRLRYAIEVPEELREVPLPPLVIQPLVENALRHGIEERPEGGEIAVRAWRQGDALHLEVRDSGLGLTGDPAPGIGLSNVRARLRGLYRDRAELLVQPNEPQGLRVQLAIPIADPEPGA